MIVFRICLPGNRRASSGKSLSSRWGAALQPDRPAAGPHLDKPRLTQNRHPYLLQDLGSTNGTVLWRGERPTDRRTRPAGVALAPGDRICLANPDNQIIVDFVSGAEEEEEDPLGRTILAEQSTKDGETERALGDDFEALQCTVRLAREMAGLDAVHDIATLTAATACARSRRRAPRFSSSPGRRLDVEAMELRRGIRQRRLAFVRPKAHRRCLAERKGFCSVRHDG